MKKRDLKDYNRLLREEKDRTIRDLEETIKVLEESK